MIAACLLAERANAAIATWEVSGNVRAVTNTSGQPVNDPFFTSLGVVPGTPWVVTLVVDEGVPDTFPNPIAGTYDAGLLYASLEVGGYYLVRSDLGFRFLRTTADTTLQSTPVGGSVYMGWSYAATEFSVAAVAAAHGTFPTDALPLAPPPSLEELVPHPDSQLAMFDNQNAPGVLVTGDVLGWTIVPEPESLALLALALSVVVARRLTAGGA